MYILETVGKNIKRIRSECGYTVETLSKGTGIAFSTISMIERGKNNTSILVLEKIANALDVPLSTLFEPNEEATAATHPPRHMFRHTDRINKLPDEERKSINRIVGDMLTLIEAADKKRGDQNVPDCDMR